MNRIGNIAIGLLVAGLFSVPAPAETRIEKELPLAPGGRVEVDTDAGSVTLTGSNRQGARVVVTSRADDLEKYWDFRFDSSENAVRIVAERKDEYRRGSSKIPSPSFEIEIPRQTSVLVDTAGGSIEIEEISGDASLDTAGGGIEVRNLDGALQADTAGGSIRVERVSGDASLDTAGGSIRVYGAGGRVDADTSGGSIEVEFTRGNASGGSLETMGGSIRILVDPTVGLDIDASTLGGTVSTALPVTVQGTVKKSSLRGKLGPGGASLDASTMGGSIRIDPLE